LILGEIEKMGKLIDTRQLIKYAAAFLFAIAVMVIFTTANVSAVTDTWENAKGTNISENSTITIGDGSSGTLTIESGTVNIQSSGTATISANLTVSIANGATVNWTADLQTGSPVYDELVTFTGSGSVNMNDADISGSAAGPLVGIGSDINSAIITSSSFTNSSSYALGTSSADVTITDSEFSSSSTSAVFIIDGDVDINGNSEISYTGASSTTAAIQIANDATVEISGNTDINGGTYGYGIHVNGEGAELSITSEDVTVSGTIGIYIYAASIYTVTISGGTIEGTNAGITVAGSRHYRLVINENDGDTLISANASTGHAIHVSNTQAEIEIAAGTISGSTALYIVDVTTYPTEITGGTLDGKNGYGLYLDRSNAVISPTASANVIIKGTLGAIMEYTANIDYSGAEFVYIEYDYETAPTEGTYPQYLNNQTYIEYYIFTDTVPSFDITANGGEINGDGSYGRYNYDESLTITPIEEPGKTFSHWESVGFYLEDPFMREQYIYVPMNNVTLTAIFETGALSDNTEDDFTPALPDPDSVPGEIEDWYKPEYFLKISSKYGSSYVNRDFTVIPLIRDGVIDDKTSVVALEAALRLAKEANIEKIFIKLPEGTEYSDSFTKRINVLTIRYGIKISVVYSE
jgi:hypothetical protein